MKATKEHLSEMKSAFDSIDAYEYGKQYARAGLTHTQFRWDAFHHARGRGLIRDLYKDGLNDNHIDTALRAVLGGEF